MHLVYIVKLLEGNGSSNLVRARGKKSLISDFYLHSFANLYGFYQITKGYVLIHPTVCVF